MGMSPIQVVNTETVVDVEPIKLLILVLRQRGTQIRDSAICQGTYGSLLKIAITIIVKAALGKFIEVEVFGATLHNPEVHVGDFQKDKLKWMLASDVYKSCNVVQKNVRLHIEDPLTAQHS